MMGFGVFSAIYSSDYVLVHVKSVSESACFKNGRGEIIFNIMEVVGILVRILQALALSLVLHCPSNENEFSTPRYRRNGVNLS